MPEVINRQKIETLKTETTIQNFNRLIDNVARNKTWFTVAEDGQKVGIFEIIDVEKLKSKFESKMRLAETNAPISDILDTVIYETFNDNFASNLKHATIYERLLFVLKTLAGNNFYLLADDEFNARQNAFSGEFSDPQLNKWLGTKSKE